MKIEPILYLYGVLPNSGMVIVWCQIAPTGLEVIRLPLVEIVEWLLTASGLKHGLQLSRNKLIRKRYTLGEGLSDLARAFGISPQRVYQIVHFERK